MVERGPTITGTASRLTVISQPYVAIILQHAASGMTQRHAAIGINQ